MTKISQKQAPYRVGTIGFGNMGSKWAAQFVADSRWQLVSICDQNADRRNEAAILAPNAHVTDDAEAVLAEPSIDVVGLFTLADHRPDQIRRALAVGKHIIAEKPIAPDLETEKTLLSEIEAHNQLVAVNLFNRNAWYHHEIQAFIEKGEIGKVGVLRVCHMTSGRLPGVSHEPEGPCFRDCGMHYVDVLRWYAGCEYAHWHSQGVRMWAEPEPWWVTVHGQFESGIAFEITQGFVYGQTAKDWTCRCYFEAIGTQGIARYHHDFTNVNLEMHGTHETVRKIDSYGDKKLDVMTDLFARSLGAGCDLGLPNARDSVIASRIAQQMHNDAVTAKPPCIGDEDDLQFAIKNKTQK